MLVLSRRPGEELLIVVEGVQIVVKVITTSLGRAKLGLTATDDVKIYRKELIDRVRNSANGEL